jgi:hypothetical protein
LVFFFYLFLVLSVKPEVVVSEDAVLFSAPAIVPLLEDIMSSVVVVVVVPAPPRPLSPSTSTVSLAVRANVLAVFEVIRAASFAVCLA